MNFGDNRAPVMAKQGHVRDLRRIRKISRMGRTGLASLVFGILAPPASAQFTVCNQTFDVVNVAIGYPEDGEFITEGWWTVGPNQCANVIREDLWMQYVYVFAQDVFGKAVLTGSAQLCVAPNRFEIRGEKDCLIRGLLSAQFHEVNTRRSERWTLFLSPPPGS